MRSSASSWNRVSIRLLFTFGVVLTLVLGFSYSSLTATGRSGYRSLARSTSVFEEMRADSTKVEMSLVNMIVGHIREGKVAGAACPSCHTREIVGTQKLRFDDAARQLEAKLRDLMTYLSRAPLAGCLTAAASLKINRFQNVYFHKGATSTD